nr:hypothetical protein [Burkholderia stagnalis]
MHDLLLDEPAAVRGKAMRTRNQPEPRHAFRVGGRDARRYDTPERDADERRAPPMRGDAARDVLRDVGDPVLRTGLVGIPEQYEWRAGRQNAGDAAQVAPQPTRGRLRDECLSAVQYDDRRRFAAHLCGEDAAIQLHRSNGTSTDPERVRFVRYEGHALSPRKRRQHEP